AHIEEAEARGAEEARRVDAELSRAQMFCRDQKDASDRMPEREDVVQWQKDQNEFFLSTVLEVVTEYAVWRDRKDAERQEPVAWRWTWKADTAACKLWRFDADLPTGPGLIEHFDALYTHPANVAALEARVKELEDAMSGISQYCEDTLDGPVKGDADMAWHREGVEEIQKRARAALTHEGGE
ncbi:hypothetical protein, partial [Gluconobacter albidus]